MRDYISLDCTPADEPCEQVGTDSYSPEKARGECLRFIAGLRKRFGPEPEGARLAIMRNPHDFGTYSEVVCHYDDHYPESVEYAFKLEAETPTTWAELEA